MTRRRAEAERPAAGRGESFMDEAAKALKEVSLDDVMEYWSLKARRCFDSLRGATRVAGTQWAGMISPLGRTPVAILQMGNRTVCQVHALGDHVLVRLIRGEALMSALRRDKTLPPAVKRIVATPGKIKFLAEIPVTGEEGARVASTVIAIKAACLAVPDVPPPTALKSARRSVPPKRPLV